MHNYHSYEKMDNIAPRLEMGMLSSVVYDVSSFIQKCWYFIGRYLKLKKIVSGKKKDEGKSSLIYLKCHNFDFHNNEFSLLQKKTTL